MVSEGLEGDGGAHGFNTTKKQTKTNKNIVGNIEWCVR
jgi:hypothetical protein